MKVIFLTLHEQRQTLAYLLARQVTGLLQRTKLNVNVICQAWHAKNARHMLLGKVSASSDKPSLIQIQISLIT